MRIAALSSLHKSFELHMLAPLVKTRVTSTCHIHSLLQKLSDHELEEMFYDKFEMTLDDVQVMLFDKGEL